MTAAPVGLLGGLGRRFLHAGRPVGAGLRHLSGMSYVLASALWLSTWGVARGRVKLRRQLAPMMRGVGARSFAIVGLVNLLTGAILVLQTGDVMQRFGQLDEMPGLVALSMTRELGPMMTAVVMTARVGASFTAVLAAMKLNDEIEALETMAIPPVGYLIAPRLLAMVVMQPCLCVLAYGIGMAGGAVAASAVYGMGVEFYVEKSFAYLKMADIWSGLIKAVVFAVLISVVSCYYGFIAAGGPTGLGRYTMVAVVTSLVAVVAADAVLTAFAVNYLYG